MPREYVEDDALKELMGKYEADLSWEGPQEPQAVSKIAMEALSMAFAEHGLFLSEHPDLEDDLVHGPLFDDLSGYFNQESPKETREAMQRRKAEHMHGFISSSPNLSKLCDDPMAAPLDYIVELVEGRKG